MGVVAPGLGEREPDVLRSELTTSRNSMAPRRENAARGVSML
jgi:hypothetical protein